MKSLTIAIVVAVASFCLSYGIAVRAGGKAEPPDLTVRSLTVKGENGHTATISPTGNGVGVFVFADGKRGVSMVSNDTGCYFGIHDGKNDVCAFAVTCGSDGKPYVQLASGQKVQFFTNEELLEK